MTNIYFFRSDSQQSIFDKSLIEELKKMIDKHNVLAQTFRRVRDFIHDHEQSDFGLRLFRHRFKDPRVYNTPVADEVAALIVGDLSTLDVGRDIIVKKVSGQLTRLHETHTCFIPLQYPLIFPYGEDGYQEDIPIVKNMDKVEREFTFLYENSLLSEYKIERLNLVML